MVQRLDVLYQDDELLAVDKPSGLASIAPDGSRARSALSIATAILRRRNPKGRAAVVHRLDRDTSGVLLFATNARVKTELMAGWDRLVLERRYVAVVEGSPPADQGTLDNWLVERNVGRVMVAGPGERGALRALTRYRVLRKGAVYSLVELDLETGRKHQIRAQLAAAGCPVAGDQRYGARSDPLGRLCLHAALLSLKRPAPREPERVLRFESPVPASFESAVNRAEAQGRGPPDRSGRGRAYGGRPPAPSGTRSGPRKSSSRKPTDTRRRPKAPRAPGT